MRAWRIRRSFGSSVKSVDDQAALSVVGVKQNANDRGLQTTYRFFRPLGGVAVLADNTWAAMQGKKETEDRLGKRARTLLGNSERLIRKSWQETARKPGKVVRERTANVDEVFRERRKDRRGGVTTPPLLAHALDGTAGCAGGFIATEKVEAWAATQNPQGARGGHRAKPSD